MYLPCTPKGILEPVIIIIIIIIINVSIGQIDHPSQLFLIGHN